jgi:hypothetical protein
MMVRDCIILNMLTALKFLSAALDRSGDRPGEMLGVRDQHGESIRSKIRTNMSHEIQPLRSFHGNRGRSPGDEATISPSMLAEQPFRRT